MKLANLALDNKNSSQADINFYGASIVTASGKEIPITEEMLQRSFTILIEAWEKAQPKSQP